MSPKQMEEMAKRVAGQRAHLWARPCKLDGRPVMATAAGITERGELEDGGFSLECDTVARIALANIDFEPKRGMLFIDSRGRRLKVMEARVDTVGAEWRLGLEAE